MRASLLLLCVPACSDTGPPAPDATYAATLTQNAVQCPDYSPLKTAYFGDLHAHTTFSYDAYTFDTRTNPFDAYAFAKGAWVRVAGADPKGAGPWTHLDRPLDFLAITDHSEMLSIDFGCGTTLGGTPLDPGNPLFTTTPCQWARSTNALVQDVDFAVLFARQNNLCNGLPSSSATCQPIIADAWHQEIAAAQSALDRCNFTSFIAYEWTNDCQGDGGQAATCHKNVIFGDTNVPAQPLDSLTYPTQESLWAALDTGCSGAPCNAITIPHNSNLSKGQALAIPQGSEKHAQTYQKLVEVFQHKGGSECFYDPQNPDTDPTCNFNYLGGASEPNLAQSYVRTRLESGLTDYVTKGVDALQLGFVGATDDHNGAPGNTREDTWPGHIGRIDDSPQKRIDSTSTTSVGYNPGGVAVAWAEQNTRESIFAAFQRRETYATSGPRIIVRTYQTWDRTSDFCADPSFPQQIVAAGGLPMGSNIALPAGYQSGAPRIVVYAARDALERADIANLGEIDLVAAWIDPASGAVKENVVRRIAPTTAGAGTMCQTFDLADTFQATTPSFYYARVLQVPTDRWSVYDCKAAPLTNIKDCAQGGKLNQQITERAWTSPMWYLP